MQLQRRYCEALPWPTVYGETHGQVYLFSDMSGIVRVSFITMAAVNEYLLHIFWRISGPQFKNMKVHTVYCFGHSPFQKKGTYLWKTI